MSIPLAVLEGIVDDAGIAPRIEALLPAGARHRQLKAATLLTGMMLVLADRRPAHLTEVHAALIALPGADQVRPGVMQDWKHGPHQLTYRQAGRTYGLVTGTLEQQHPGGAPSDELSRNLRRLAGGQHPARIQASRLGAGGGLDRRGVLLPAAPARQHRMR